MEKNQPKIIRNSKEIRVWLLRKNIYIVDVARAVGVEKSSAGKTIQGIRNNRKVLQWLLDNGCPAEHLAMPKDMQKENVLP